MTGRPHVGLNRVADDAARCIAPTAAAIPLLPLVAGTGGAQVGELPVAVFEHATGTASADGRDPASRAGKPDLPECLGRSPPRATRQVAA
ncbi:MAG TPA: hypothetical protein VMU94_31770 [Streptosporangiaceae bacterium]|nr:hypothetical protein [Streptosporangiaceae bacterium]